MIHFSGGEACEVLRTPMPILFRPPKNSYVFGSYLQKKFFSEFFGGAESESATISFGPDLDQIISFDFIQMSLRPN